jgi:hypothetical protein
VSHTHRHGVVAVAVVGMSDVPRNVGMVVAFAIGKLALRKVSVDAKQQSKNPK